MRIKRITLFLLFALMTDMLFGIGKIWYANGYLYANIPNKGVWIINNTDPATQ